MTKKDTQKFFKVLESYRDSEYKRNTDNIQHGNDWFGNEFKENVVRPFMEGLEYKRDEAYLANQ